MQVHLTRFDLTLSISDIRQQIRGELVYSTDLFSRNMATHITNRLNALVNLVANYPDTALDDIVRLTDDDAHAAGKKELINTEGQLLAKARRRSVTVLSKNDAAL
jgi:hypothetical protein